MKKLLAIWRALTTTPITREQLVAGTPKGHISFYKTPLSVLVVCDYGVYAWKSKVIKELEETTGDPAFFIKGVVDAFSGSNDPVSRALRKQLSNLGEHTVRLIQKQEGRLVLVDSIKTK